MKKPTSTHIKFDELRRNAENWLLNNDSKPGFQINEYDLLKLVHELEVYHIELEMQQEELNQTHVHEKDVETDKYEELFDLQPSANFILSSEGRILKSNLAGSVLLGVTRSQLVNFNFSIFLSGSSKKVFNLFMTDIYTTHSSKTCKVTINAKRSSLVNVSLTGILTSDEHHLFITVYENNKPALNELLQDNSNRYKRYFEDGLTGDFIADGDGTILDCNQTFLDLFGIKSKNEIIGKNVSIFHPGPSEFDEIKIKLKESKILKDYKATRIRKNGELVHIMENIIASFDAKNEIFEIKGSIYDVTVLKKAEDELKQKNEQLEILNTVRNKFFSIIAHELRAPFNGFLGLTQIMATEMPSLEKDEIQHMSEMLWHSSANLFNLLENLLHWAQMEQGLFPYNPEIVSLNSFAIAILEAELLIAENKEISIQIDIADSITVYADSNMLRSVFSNLVSNAIKFTPRGGIIKITASQLNNTRIEIVISDTGIGMTPDLLKKLFRLNKQVGRKGTEGEISSGLGLLLCKEFIDKHGGIIWANSIEGKGSDFHFVLPYKNTE